MKRVVLAVAIVVIAAGVIAARMMNLKVPSKNRPVAGKESVAVPLNLDRFVASRPDLRASLNEPPPLPSADEAKLTKPPEAQQGQTPAAQKGSRPDGSAQSRDTKRAVLSMIAQAEGMLQKDKRWEARDILSKAFFIADKQVAPLIKPQLDTLSKELVFSPAPIPDSVIHTVQRGDALVKIARKYSTTHGLLMRINRKKSDRIRVDEKLKVLTGEVKALVDKSDLTLTLLLNSAYVKQYPVCLGQDNATPTGTFVVNVKQVNPTWYPPEGGKFPFGHPNNVLGTRWMGFASKPGCSGYGIHGTTDPSTVPGRKSMGCVRMLNPDAEEVFDFVTEGTKVEIRE